MPVPYLRSYRPYPLPVAIGVDIPGYRVDYVQTWGNDFYEMYFEVTHAGGRKAYLEIDGDDNKCWRASRQ